MSQALVVRLIVMDGVHKDRVIPLPPTLFVIGRDPLCHLRPHCKSVSRRHCGIVTWLGRVLVRDLKSVNGTYVNNRKINGEAAVHDGDTLRVGSLQFVIRIRSALPVAPNPSKSDVQWLLDSPVETPDLQPGCDTSCEMMIPERFAEECAAPETPRAEPKKAWDIADMSAGQYLRDFFCQ
jgi:pSer/pThr/pTyr-binding forkhead associated (FHA) protein